MALGLVRGIRLLLGALALGAASLAFASPLQVHYSLYNASGTVFASGDVDDGSSTGLNNPVLTSDVFLTGYLAKFSVSLVPTGQDVNWSFVWQLSASADFLAKRAAVIYSAGVDAQIAIGTSASGFSGVAGNIIAADVASQTLSNPSSLAKGGTLSISNMKTGSASLDGTSTTEVWAYVGGASYSQTSSSVLTSFSSYGSILAYANVADPLLPDVIPADGGGAAPEPASLALLAGAGAVGLLRRRRDRLKPLAVPAV
jgi:hypothetical protein